MSDVEVSAPKTTFPDTYVGICKGCGVVLVAMKTRRKKNGQLMLQDRAELGGWMIDGLEVRRIRDHESWRSLDLSFKCRCEKAETTVEEEATEGQLALF